MYFLFRLFTIFQYNRENRESPCPLALLALFRKCVSSVMMQVLYLKPNVFKATLAKNALIDFENRQGLTDAFLNICWGQGEIISFPTENNKQNDCFD